MFLNNTWIMAEKCDKNESSICIICLGGFKNPRTLPCTHYFCELCISEHIVSTVTQPGQNTFNCPVCRYVVEAADSTEDKSRWVLLLPLKLISKISEKTKQQNCHPCELLEQKVIALKWCCDCNEALCQTCSDVHSRFKMSAKHNTVLIENTKNPITFLETVNDSCAIHRDRRIEMYCSGHKSALCNQCLFDKHRECDRIHIIDGSEGLTEENFNSLKTQLNKLQRTVKTLIEGKNENKTELTSTFSSVEEDALQIVTQLKMKLDDLYIEFLKKTGIKQDKIQDELDHTLRELGKYNSGVGDLMQKLEHVHLYGSSVQRFLVTKDIESKIVSTVQNLEKLFKKDEHIQIKSTFKGVLQIFENLKELGELPESRTQDKSHFTKTMRDLGLDILFDLLEPEFPTIGLKFASIYRSHEIFTCVPLDNEICAVLFPNLLALVNTSTNETIDRHAQAANSKKVCFDSERKMLYSTCNRNMGLECNVAGNKIISSRNVLFNRAINGIDVCDGKIYTIRDNAITCTQSENFRSQEVCPWISVNVSGMDDDIAIDKTSKRFAVSVNATQEIRFGSIIDNYLKQFTSCRKFNDVVGIAFGPSGILFVAEQPSSIHVISHDEKSVKTLMTKLKFITKINDIDIASDNKKLYVCGDGGVEIYDIIRSKTVY